MKIEDGQRHTLNGHREVRTDLARTKAASQSWETLDATEDETQALIEPLPVARATTERQYPAAHGCHVQGASWAEMGRKTHVTSPRASSQPPTLLSSVRPQP